MSRRARAPTTVIVVQALFFLNAALWIVFGALGLARMVSRPTEPPSIGWIISLLMLANAAVMLWLGWGLGKGRKLFFYLAIPVLVVNSVLSVTDQFGLLDLIALAIDVALLILLIVTRSRYQSIEPASE